jgi:site-specific DNA-methyltransferase (cytosine-N4-specific)
VIHKLQADGLVELQKNLKHHSAIPAGRGGKPAFVKPTAKFEKEVAEPLLAIMFKAAKSAQIREIRRKPLSEIVVELNSKDGNKSGKALEYLAVRLCMLLDLDFLDWRATDEKLAAGGEVDALLHSARLVYSRWQVQCKIGKITLEAVAKEVGMQIATLANVILVVSNGSITDGAKTFREHLTMTATANCCTSKGCPQ